MYSVDIYRNLPGTFSLVVYAKGAASTATATMVTNTVIILAFPSFILIILAFPSFIPS
jgi:hypothetical protein